jgi:hypothetical protein
VLNYFFFLHFQFAHSVLQRFAVRAIPLLLDVLKVMLHRFILMKWLTFRLFQSSPPDANVVTFIATVQIH